MLKNGNENSPWYFCAVEITWLSSSDILVFEKDLVLVFI